MPRTGLAYEKPSRASQGLVVAFSIAVVIMGGWLAMTILFAPDITTVTANDSDIETASAPPYVENVSPVPTRLSATAPSNSTYPEPWAYTPYGAAPPAPPRSALPLASPAEPPAVGTPGAPYTTSSISVTVPDSSYRGLLADEPPRQTEAAIEATDTAPDVVPLPRPRRTASIPVPRPRPHLDAEDAQSSAEQSFFDLLVNRQR